ncbi:AraC family transcriptional regulator [Marinobacter sp. VGCF2001]|uniref:AraC family transcriptional regulator n=1 Tax=Marinobacter sp. VGCF2001 TaxID=3417189 RepID=UPI003CF9DB75
MFGRQKTQKCRIAPGIRGLFISGVIVAIFSATSHASSLEEQIERLSADIMRHSARVNAVEQRLLHPVNTRVAVFLSLANRQALELDSVELFVDDQPVTAHLYGENERNSLAQGGVHQLFLGNLADGQHSLKAVINARASNNRFVRREITHQFRKEPGALRLQMTLSAQAPDYEPDVSFVEWK